jgi:hypothetical protein
VRYVRTVGNGKQGRWVIRAFAKKGYEITSGATTRWSGNLGRFEKCLGISAVSVQDDSTSEAWLVSVRLDVPKSETRTLRVIYEFKAEVVISGSQGSNWTCTGPDGSEIVSGEELTVGPSADVTCRYAGSGRRPLVSLRLTDSVPPGSATLTANNGFVAHQPFAG